MANIVTASPPYELRPLCDERPLCIAERLAPTLEQPTRQVRHSRMLAIAAAVSKLVLLGLVCAVASIAIWALGLRLIVGIDLLDVVQAK